LKLLLVGLWVTLVALGAAYGASRYASEPGAQTASASAVVLQSQKTRVINVPVVADGLVRGFVAVQFVFTMDANALKALPVPADVYLLDEAFRDIYSDTSLDPHHVDRYDLQKLTSRIVQNTNERLGAPLIKDVLIENFNYIDKDTDRT
jgi:hypothetical protein